LVLVNIKAIAMKHRFYVGRILFTLCAMSWIAISIHAQTPAIERLRNDLAVHTDEDTFHVNRLNSLAFELRNKIPKESAERSQQALDISRKISYAQGEATALMALGFYHRHKGEFQEAANYAGEALTKFVELKDTASLIACIYNLSFAQAAMGKLTESFMHSLDALGLAEKSRNTKWIILCKTQMGANLVGMKETAKSKIYLTEAMQLADSVNDIDGLEHCLTWLGRIAEMENKPEDAAKFYRRKVEVSGQLNDYYDELLGKLSLAGLDLNQGRYKDVLEKVPKLLATANKQGFSGVNTWGSALMAKAYLRLDNPDSAIKYGLRAIVTQGERHALGNVQSVHQVLGEAYSKKGQYKEAYQYLTRHLIFKDSLNESEAIRNVAAIQFTSDLDKKQSEIDLLARNQLLIKSQSDQQQRMLWVTGTGIVLLVAMLVLLWRINVRRQRTNLELHQQQQELKAAQSLLIQSEKMASLGELTAGIAHEIQNPLNFVNNFSDLNKELIDELESELNKGNSEEAKSIAASVRENQIKIVNHGKRADAIVKGMLEHSRSGSGVKEPTNINALADEYLKLAFHGLRAKDTSFNAATTTNYDSSIGNISIIRQDIGRVLLNLLNNAFYAVSEKKKNATPEYEPIVNVVTHRVNGVVKVTIQDNGNGIPEKILDKIFQPFFTTKPTGQGTGLGLSLSYDIVKAHGGELKVSTAEGKGTEFVVQLPIKG
jgi:two-component system, NtrC family, sensor kinase